MCCVWQLLLYLGMVMKYKWPTLYGRLNQPFTSEGEAIAQMKANGDVLTPLAEKILKKYEGTKRKSSKRVRARVKQTLPKA